MSDQYCFLCDKTLEPNRAVALPSCQHGNFHFDCIVNLFSDLIVAGTSIACPVCGARAPTSAASTHISIKQIVLLPRPLRTVLLSPPNTVLNATFNDVWSQVWAKLKAARDAEAKYLMVDAPSPELAPDVTGQDLYTANPQTSYMEMTTACWICHKLLGNLHWILLGSCGHRFHVRCITMRFYHQLAGSGLPQSRCPTCPLCTSPASRGRARLGVSLVASVDNYFRKVPEDVIAYCINFLVENE